MISTAIQQLVNYGLDTGLILPDDEIYIRNQLLMTMQLDSFTEPEEDVCYTNLRRSSSTPRKTRLPVPANPTIITAKRGAPYLSTKTTKSCKMELGTLRRKREFPLVSGKVLHGWR